MTEVFLSQSLRSDLDSSISRPAETDENNSSSNEDSSSSNAQKELRMLPKIKTLKLRERSRDYKNVFDSVPFTPSQGVIPSPSSGVHYQLMSPFSYTFPDSPSMPVYAPQSTVLRNVQGQSDASSSSECSNLNPHLSGSPRHSMPCGPPQMQAGFQPYMFIPFAPQHPHGPRESKFGGSSGSGGPGSALGGSPIGTPTAGQVYSTPFGPNPVHTAYGPMLAASFPAAHSYPPETGTLPQQAHMPPHVAYYYPFGATPMQMCPMPPCGPYPTSGPNMQASMVQGFPLYPQGFDGRRGTAQPSGQKDAWVNGVKSERRAGVPTARRMAGSLPPRAPVAQVPPPPPPPSASTPIPPSIGTAARLAASIQAPNRQSVPEASASSSNRTSQTASDLAPATLSDPLPLSANQALPGGRHSITTSTLFPNNNSTPTQLHKPPAAGRYGPEDSAPALSENGGSVTAELTPTTPSPERAARTSPDAATAAGGVPKLNARQRRTLRRAMERAFSGLKECEAAGDDEHVLAVLRIMRRSNNENGKEDGVQNHAACGGGESTKEDVIVVEDSSEGIDVGKLIEMLSEKKDGEPLNEKLVRDLQIILNITGKFKIVIKSNGGAALPGMDC